MEIINIAVITKDKEYAAALAWAIVRNTQGMEVWVLDDFHSFVMPDGSLDEKTNIDVILTDKAPVVNEISASGKKDNPISKNDKEQSDPLVVSLSDKMSNERPHDNVIFKYKNIKTMIKDIYYMLARVKGRQMINDVEHDMDVYCFASERGGSGCTDISLGFAGEIVRSGGKKVIYISLDQFPERIVSLKDGNIRTLKQYIYHILLDEKTGQHTITDTYLMENRQGVDCFNVDNGLNPLLELDLDGYIRFLKSLLCDGMHQALVIDCGDQVSMQMLKAFDISRKIFLVTDNRGENHGWRNFVGRMIDESVRKKIVRIDSGKYDVMLSYR